MITKTCKISDKKFKITAEDLEFYAKIEIISQKDSAKLKSREISYCVGLPTLCPDERARRRLAWRNERKLYSRKCDLCAKTIVSLYDKDTNFPVYCQDCWWSDNWDAQKFSRDFDFSKSFFEQFAELVQQTPRMAMAGSHCENSKYAPFSIYTKNGYLAVSCCYSEDVYYSYQANRSRDCVDCSLCDQCELGYQNINCQNCFEVRFSSFSRNCSSSWFLNNCIGCSDCFGCINLRNKQYYFLNKKYSKDEYEKKVRELNLESGKNLSEFPAKFLKFTQQHPHRYYYGENNENCTGNDIFNCKNSQECYECRDLEDCKWCGPHPSPGGKDCYDSMYSPNSKLLCDVLSGVNGYNSLFLVFSWDIKDSQYLNECFYSHNLFDCIGLKNAQYCILNKQYTKEEYFKTREKIIEHMKNTGEWGEFFPIELSPFCYNETVAQEYFPLNPPKSELKDQKLFQSSDLGFKYKWKNKISRDFKPATIENIPNDIKEVDDSICREILACKNKECGKNYQIQKAELKFYRKMNLPIPRKCPDCRHAERMKLRNPRTLFSRQCAECKTDIQTTFSPDRPEKVLCENCYLKIVD